MRYRRAGTSPQISIRIMVQRTFRQPLPPLTKVLFHDILIELRKNRRLAFKVAPEPFVPNKSFPYLFEETYPPITFGRNGPHDVHPAGCLITRRNGPAI